MSLPRVAGDDLQQPSAMGPTWCGVGSTHPEIRDMIPSVPATVVSQYFALVLAHSSCLFSFYQECPYIQDRVRRGLATEPLGPDGSEMWAARGCAAAGGVQLTHMGFARSRTRLIPTGLAPLTHFDVAWGADSPLEYPVSIPDDLDFASRMITADHNYDSWQRTNLRKLEIFLRNLVAFNLFFNQTRGENSVAVAPQVKVGGIDVLSRSIGWPDIALPFMMTAGAQIVGGLPRCNVFRNAKKRPGDGYEIFHGYCQGLARHFGGPATPQNRDHDRCA